MRKIILLILLCTSTAFAQKTETVHFPIGSSSAHLQRDIPGGQFMTFFVAARKGQTMTVSALSPTYNVDFKVLKEDNAIGTSSNDHAAQNWMGKLPYNGVYAIQVHASGGVGHLTLDIVIR